MRGKQRYISIVSASFNTDLAQAGFGGLKPCLSAWKSAQADSLASPKRFYELSRRL